MKEDLWIKKLTKRHGKFLIDLARNTILKELGIPEQKDLDEEMEKNELLNRKAGVFVTIYKNNDLRGCIGNILPEKSIIEGVKDNAINAAFRDPRFPPLSKHEVDDIKIEVSVLSPPEKLEYDGPQDLIKKLRPNIDGVIIQKGWAKATFLPQVWEKLPNPKDFLTHLCFKAGLYGNAWQKEPLEVYTYEVVAFEEE